MSYIILYSIIIYMKELNVLILIFFIFFSLSYQFYIIDKEITLNISNIDNKEYFVLRMNDSQKAADQLSIINNKIKKLFDYCKNNPGDKIKDVNRMINKYNFDELSELNPDSKYTAYSLNKGERIKLCLRDKSMNLINNINTSMFIMCHELSHLMTTEEQHPPIFWDNMVYILKKSSECGIYESINYEKYPVSYGSSIVNKNPLFTEKETNKTKKYPYIN